MFSEGVASRYGTPGAVARAPGRVNLIGEHVDYCGGPVMPIAIPLACRAAIVPDVSSEGRCTVSSTLTAETIAFDPDRPPRPGEAVPVGSWPSYVLGVLAGVAEHAPLTPLGGCHIHIDSQVPLGGGLSSSAALEVSVALAVSAFLSVSLDRIELARLCQQAEHRFAGVPCGLMDQAASLLASADHALLLDCATGLGKQVLIPSATSFLVVDSGVRHSLASSEYALRRAWCESAAGRLGVARLADGDPDRISELDAPERDAATHVLGEIARVNAAAHAFREADLDTFGRLMNESHASLRDIYRVSCPEIDAIVAALYASGAVHGARITGGGFGGCVIALIREGQGDRALAAIQSCRSVCPRLSTLDVHASDGARVVTP